MKKWKYDPPDSESEVDAFYAHPDRITLLPLRLRIAWVTSVIETIVLLFSPAARSRFLLGETIGFAWDFVKAGKIDSKVLSEMIKRVKSKLEEATPTEYGPEFVLMCFLILVEIRDNQGGACESALSYAAVMFSCHQLWRQGVNGANVQIPRTYVHALELPFLRFAKQTLDLAHQDLNIVPTPEMFTPAILDKTFFPIPNVVLKSCKRTPPILERNHIQQLYG